MKKKTSICSFSNAGGQWTLQLVIQAQAARHMSVNIYRGQRVYIYGGKSKIDRFFFGYLEFNLGILNLSSSQSSFHSVFICFEAIHLVKASLLSLTFQCQPLSSSVHCTVHSSVLWQCSALQCIERGLICVIFRLGLALLASPDYCEGVWTLHCRLQSSVVVHYAVL